MASSLDSIYKVNIIRDSIGGMARRFGYDRMMAPPIATKLRS